VQAAAPKKVLRPPAGKYWRWSQTKIDEALATDLIVVSKNDVPQYKKYLDEAEGVPVQSIWGDLKMLGRPEMLGYPTQKPESLLERVISASSNEGDLVLDCFVGSGTTAAVAEKLNRRWIGCDLGRFAIHTTRKRLLNIPDCRPFDIKNLGAYERQHWQQASTNGAVRAYLDTILAFYRAEPVEGFAALHGRKAGRMVHVGATDAPVTIDEAEEVMDEMADNGIEACDVLGWEWEMGLHDTVPRTRGGAGSTSGCARSRARSWSDRSPRPTPCASSSSPTSTSTCVARAARPASCSRTSSSRARI